MFITGLGTAAPRNRFKQSECWHVLKGAPEFSALSARSQAILRKVLTGNNGIDTRNLALENLSDAFNLNPDALHERFAKHAPELAAEAARSALRNAGCTVEEIDAVVISTCTGYLCPGLTSYVSELLGLKQNVLALDLVGQGCGAALPNLRMGEALIASGRCARVLSICVEVCSAAFYLDDDPGVLISACLFGDGAGAAVLSNQVGKGRKVEWVDSGSRIEVKDRDFLRFEQKNGMLRNVLRPEVPEKAARHAEAVLDDVLGRAGMRRVDIAQWIWHAGGREVLAALRQRLSLSEMDVFRSAMVMREYGNLSSACVYFVLKSALDEGAPNGTWWMSSFGAGFSCHGALLNVSG